MHDFVRHNPAQDVVEQLGMRPECKSPVMKDEGAALIAGPRRHAHGRTGRAGRCFLHNAYGKIAWRFVPRTRPGVRTVEPIQLDGYVPQQPGRLGLGRGQHPAGKAWESIYPNGEPRNVVPRRRRRDERVQQAGGPNQSGSRSKHPLVLVSHQSDNWAGKTSNSCAIDQTFSRRSKNFLSGAQGLGNNESI